MEKQNLIDKNKDKRRWLRFYYERRTKEKKNSSKLNIQTDEVRSSSQDSSTLHWFIFFFRGVGSSFSPSALTPKEKKGKMKKKIKKKAKARKL